MLTSTSSALLKIPKGISDLILQKEIKIVFSSPLSRKTEVETLFLRFGHFCKEMFCRIFFFFWQEEIFYFCLNQISWCHRHPIKLRTTKITLILIFFIIQFALIKSSSHLKAIAFPMVVANEGSFFCGLITPLKMGPWNQGLALGDSSSIWLWNT